MNIKLITILSVAIALVSALTFVNVYQKAQQAAGAQVAVARSLVARPTAPTFASPDTTTGSADVTASVKIGQPDDVTAQVTILR